MVTVTVIGGPMSVGKTEELVRRTRRAEIAKQRFLIIIPDIDTRSGNFIAVRERDENHNFVPVPKYPAFPISIEDGEMALRTLLQEQEPDLLIIDEGQFFHEWLWKYLETLSFRKDLDMEIVISLLDRDASGKIFGYSAQFMAIANEVIKLTAICMKCHNPKATLTQKTEVGSGQQIEIGFKQYEARCVLCWEPPPS